MRQKPTFKNDKIAEIFYYARHNDAKSARSTIFRQQRRCKHPKVVQDGRHYSIETIFKHGSVPKIVPNCPRIIFHSDLIIFTC